MRHKLCFADYGWSLPKDEWKKTKKKVKKQVLKSERMWNKAYAKGGMTEEQIDDKEEKIREYAFDRLEKEFGNVKDNTYFYNFWSDNELDEKLSPEENYKNYKKWFDEKYAKGGKINEPILEVTAYHDTITNVENLLKKHNIKLDDTIELPKKGYANVRLRGSDEILFYLDLRDFANQNEIVKDFKKIEGKEQVYLTYRPYADWVWESSHIDEHDFAKGGVVDAQKLADKAVKNLKGYSKSWETEEHLDEEIDNVIYDNTNFPESNDKFYNLHKKVKKLTLKEFPKGFAKGGWIDFKSKREINKIKKELEDKGDAYSIKYDTDGNRFGLKGGGRYRITTGEYLSTTYAKGGEIKDSQKSLKELIAKLSNNTLLKNHPSHYLELEYGGYEEYDGGNLITIHYAIPDEERLEEELHKWAKSNLREPYEIYLSVDDYSTPEQGGWWTMVIEQQTDDSYSGPTPYAKGGETEDENTDLISGDEALQLYASEEIFTSEQDLRIDQAIDGQDLEIDDIRHDFREWALYNQKDWFEEDEEISGNDRALEVFRDFDEFYDNGLTHRQNWTAFLEYAQDELPKYRKGGVILYKDPNDSYTIVIDDSVFDMNEHRLNYDINTYIGERSEFPQDVSHWGKKINLKDAPIVIRDKIKERQNTSFEKGGTTKTPYNYAPEWNNITENKRKDILSLNSCSPKYSSYSYKLLNPDTKEQINIYFETNKDKLGLSKEERETQISMLEQALTELGGKDRELEAEIKKLKGK